MDPWLNEPIGPPTDWSFCAIDVETTGLDAKSDAIVEVAAVRFCDGEPVESFSTLVNPCRPIPPCASAVHLIGDEDVRFSPLWHDVEPKLRAFVGEELIVSHNAPFDSGFLPCLSDRRWICTLRLSRHLWPSAPSHALQFLRFHLGISGIGLQRDKAHAADNDAVLAGYLFRRELTELLVSAPISDIGDLMRFVGAPLPIKTLRHGRKHRNTPLSDVPASYLKAVLIQTR